MLRVAIETIPKWLARSRLRCNYKEMNRYKIGLIEDDSLYAREFQIQLANQFEIVVFADAKSAIENKMQTLSLDALLIDIYLPDESGFGAVQKLRDQKCPLPPILFITSDLLEETKIMGLRMGVCDFLQKSMSWTEILHRVQNALAHARAPRKFSFGNLIFYPDRFSCEYLNNHETVELTKIELQLLSYLFRDSDGAQREALEKELWHSTSIVSNSIHSHVSNLNKKLNSWDHQVRILRNGRVQLCAR